MCQIVIGYGQGGKTSYSYFMIKKMMSRIKAVLVGTKKDDWAKKQIKEMAKLGGRLVL